MKSRIWYLEAGQDNLQLTSSLWHFLASHVTLFHKIFFLMELPMFSESAVKPFALSIG